VRQRPDGLVEVGRLALPLLLFSAPEIDPGTPGANLKKSVSAENFSVHFFILKYWKNT
jgi:hypothetical protein